MFVLACLFVKCLLSSFTRHPAIISRDLGLSPASLSPSHARSPHRITVHRYSGGSDDAVDGTGPYIVCSPRKKIIDPGWTWRSWPRPWFLLDPPIRGISMTLTSTDDSKLDAVPLTCSWTVHRYSECDVTNDIHHVLFIKIRMTFWRCLMLVFHGEEGVLWSTELQNLETWMFDLPSYSHFLLRISIFNFFICSTQI